MYAHTLPGRPESEWEPLEKHLAEVSELAAQFGGAFGAADLARAAGLWHDLGKYSLEFQQMLRDAEAGRPVGRVDHSTAGAQHAASRGQVGRLLAYCIAGHHGGLPDHVADQGESDLRNRLVKDVPAWRHAAEPSLLDLALRLPSFPRAKGMFTAAFLTRMVFSCLVDADFLATERFMSPKRAAERPDGGGSPAASPADLLATIDAHLLRVEKGARPTLVNACRARVLRACRGKAPLAPGFFSLNVPTGGGKTLSSLAFALAHAAAHGHRRVVYAIPYTSIIEQTADVFRRSLGHLAGHLLEHHSSIDPEDEKGASVRSRLAAENFDAPLIVTTNVQLFESMFACSTSRCRKLHRLARSVIVLDEAQALPPSLLDPTLAALKELVGNYGCSVVLCTATQPALEHRENFPIGLEGVRPIIDDPLALHGELRRTKIDHVGRLTCDDLAQRLLEQPRALCIVNTKSHAQEVFQILRDAGGEPLHLSARMCAAHRSDVLDRVKARLGGDGPCRVVATQVIEAGVDVDFPVVYRAAAGLDSIAQAAGRCNREGKQALGRVFVFDYDVKEYRTPHDIGRAAAHFKEVAPDHQHDLLSPAAVNQYFRLHYWQQGGTHGKGWDEGCESRGSRSVMACFGKGDGQEPFRFQFRHVTEIYRLIPDAQTPILVPFDERAAKLRDELLSLPDAAADLALRLRKWDRAAQRYSVGMYENDLRKLTEGGVLLERHGRYALGNQKAYDDDLGLTLRESGLDPEWLVS